LILTPGLINLDFSDIKAAISGMGIALIGNAVAKGPSAVVEAARAAITLLCWKIRRSGAPAGADEYHGFARYRPA